MPFNRDACCVQELPFSSLDFGQVQVQIQVRPITIKSFAAHLTLETARIRQLLASRDGPAPRKAVVIVDGSVALLPPAEARRMQADWLRANAELLKLVTHELGFVLPNPLLRGFVSAVFYLAPLPVPTTTHASLDEAIAWAVQEAQNIGGHVAPTLIAGGAAAVERARAEALSKVQADVIRLRSS